LTARAYDAFERPIRVCYTSSASACQAGPTAVSESIGYDHNGVITSHTTRAGQAFSFAYDALNRMTVKTAPSGMRSVYYAYDLQGNVTAAHFDSAGGADQVSAAYDALGRPTSATTVMAGVSRALAYQYDALGDVTHLTNPDGVYFTMAYDHLQRVTEAWWTTSGGTTPFYGIAYDDLGARTYTGRGSSQTNYTYDTVSRLASVAQQFAANAGNVTKGFGRDAASGVVSQTRDNDDFRFGYSAINRSYSANALNQYIAAGPATLGYDANGNLTSDGTNTFAYDSENKLASATTAGGTSLPTTPWGGSTRPPARRSGRRSSPTTASTWWRNTMPPGRCCGASSGGPEWTSRCCRTRAGRSTARGRASCTGTTWARSWRPPTAGAIVRRWTPTTNTACQAPATGVGSSTPDRRGSRTWG
jgi:YD repeat-containing protein